MGANLQTLAAGYTKLVSNLETILEGLMLDDSIPEIWSTRIHSVYYTIHETSQGNQPVAEKIKVTATYLKDIIKKEIIPSGYTEELREVAEQFDILVFGTLFSTKE